MAQATIGDISVQTVVEGNRAFGTPEENFPDATPELIAPHLDWFAPRAYDPASNMLIMPTQAYVVKTAKHTIVIDTCVGNYKRVPDYPNWQMRDDFKLLEDMAAVGVHPDEVDYVMCTHLHVDHCGWNTRRVDGRWVPCFKNARYIFNRSELAFAEEQVSKANDPTYEDSVLPILEAGKAVVVDNEFSLDDQVWLEPTPGHTPGHVAVRMHSRHARAVMSGDLIHSPIQLAYPQWSPFYDDDPELAKVTRRRFLEQQCDQDILMMTAHFPLPSMGHVIRRGDGFGFRYLD